MLYTLYGHHNSCNTAVAAVVVATKTVEGLAGNDAEYRKWWTRPNRWLCYNFILYISIFICVLHISIIANRSSAWKHWLSRSLCSFSVIRDSRLHAKLCDVLWKINNRELFRRRLCLMHMKTDIYVKEYVIPIVASDAMTTAVEQSSHRNLCFSNRKLWSGATTEKLTEQVMKT